MLRLYRLYIPYMSSLSRYGLRIRRVFTVYTAGITLMQKLLCLIPPLLLSATTSGLAAEPGFESIFDGASLRGWETPWPQYWSVEDGAITARITKDRPCQTNEYLVWSGGELADFELKLRSRVQGEGGINNGFQFRSRVLPDHDVCGYQVDNNLQTDWLVRLYDEFGRHTLAWRGERATFNPAGERAVERIPDAAGPAWFRLEDWHEYDLTCIGHHLTLRVDGRLAAEVEDLDERRAELQGALALQLHSGPPTFVQFKDIRLKVLKNALAPVQPSVSPELQTLRQRAVAWWNLDTFGHGAKPTLRHIPQFEKFELNVVAAGPGATPAGKVLVLNGAYGESGADLICCQQPMTVYARVRAPQGKWDGTLLNKAVTGGAPVFSLFGKDGEITFAISTQNGSASVRFAMDQVDPRAWHDLIGRYNGENLELYCDGRRVAQRGLIGELVSSSEPVLIGAERQGGNPTHFFIGEMEVVAIWAEALEAAQINLLSPAR